MVDVRIEAIAIVRKFNQLEFNDDELESEIKSLCAKVERQKAASVLENAIDICDAFAKIWKAQRGNDYAEAAMRIVQRLEMELSAYSPGSGPVQKEND